MKVAIKSITRALLLLMLSANVSFGEQTTRKHQESGKYRTIFTIAGGGGGFTLGALAGLAAFDDAPYANRKIWTAALLSAAGGIAGGYLLGLALDKRRNRNITEWKQSPAKDELDRSLVRARLSIVGSLEYQGYWDAALPGFRAPLLLSKSPWR